MCYKNKPIENRGCNSESNCTKQSVFYLQSQSMILDPTSWTKAVRIDDHCWDINRDGQLRLSGTGTDFQFRVQDRDIRIVSYLCCTKIIRSQKVRKIQW